MNPVLLLHEDPLFTQALRDVCEPEAHIQHGADPAQLEDWLRRSGQQPQLVLLDLQTAACIRHPAAAISLMRRLMQQQPTPAVLALCTGENSELARQARACGIHQLLHRPCNCKQLLEAVTQLQHRVAQGQTRTASQPVAGCGQDDLDRMIARFADLPYPVLVSGESGCGKEWVARGLHQNAQRHAEPFLSVNCAAIADSLFEAVLFGHARGAYTGAQQGRAGMFEDAGNGTLFLDEIGELSLPLQAKMLRVLENGEFLRVGETRPRFAAARIVAATNRDLGSCVRSGQFRSDLFHRLAVLTIRVAPLRERPGDKMRLWDYYINLITRQMACPPCWLSAAAMDVWMEYDFPGNVREVRNVVIRLLAAHAGSIISAACLHSELEGPTAAAASPIPAVQDWLDVPDFQLDRALKRLEGDLIRSALRRSDGNVSAAARMLGLRRTTLYSRMGCLEVGA